MTRILGLFFHLGITFSPMVNDQEWCEQGKARDETGMEVHPYDVPCGGKFPLSGNLLSPVIPNVSNISNWNQNFIYYIRKNSIQITANVDI